MLMDGEAVLGMRGWEWVTWVIVAWYKNQDWSENWGWSKNCGWNFDNIH
jgi:hypothetical protein